MPAPSLVGYGPLALDSSGAHYLAHSRVEGEDPLASFPPPPRASVAHGGFDNAADIMVGSFYDPEIEEGCAFEELISFHGGLGGPQTRPFILSPKRLPVPTEPIIGAAAVHRVLSTWRRELNGAV